MSPDDDLQTRAVWAPLDDSGDEPIAYVSERGRRRLALLGPLAAVAVLAACLAAGLGLPIALLASCAPLVAASVITMTGRSGYYTLRRDGRLDAFLGHRPPDLSGYRRVSRGAVR